jgi:indolepyruvate ferredoxin oxidoreductase
MSAVLRDVKLEDKYLSHSGRVYLTGTQALVRLAIMQRERDAAAGLNTAGFISGYRGSPIGTFDLQAAQSRKLLEQSHIVFRPGVNEDLAATSVWGTQQVGFFPGAKYDGVFAMWYGKGPGVDRSGDAIKHGNRAGTSKHGGVLLIAGDDHPGKSSTVCNHSEPVLAALGVPTLYPSNVQEILDFGLHGFAMSRFSGSWVGFKTVNETVEMTATADVDPSRVQVVIPGEFPIPEGGLSARPTFMVDRLGDEVFHAEHRLPAVQAYAHANGLDRVVLDSERRGLGIVTAGKSYLDVRQALDNLGIDAARAAQLGVRVYKPGLIWPMEPRRLTDFARGHEWLLVVEEKAAFMEPQVAWLLYDLPESERPRLLGKRDESGRPLVPGERLIDPLQLAAQIGQLLVRAGQADEALKKRLELLERHNEAASRGGSGSALPRVPWFCSGCPHNTSTRIPDGSIAMSGIGCHGMASWMNRSTAWPTQMGGEGVNWAGMAPFTNMPHVFQNLGDGTYFHSGIVAIRAAVASGANITYKLLYNDAVAMTGGQPLDGQMSVSDLVAQLQAERLKRVVVVTDEPENFSGVTLGQGAEVHHRDELDAIQRRFREIKGVTAIVYVQTCAAEKRRRRKKGKFPDPAKRAFINDEVCEGCGDCSVKSNCVSVLPLETEFGRKREIDQSNCNKDFSCINGFCPSFVTVQGGSVRKPKATELGEDIFGQLPAPVTPAISGSYDITIAGVGGTGVVTVGAVLGMAAHLEHKGVSIFDMTGLAQKNGAVLSHLRIANSQDELASASISLGEAELVLGCDLIVTDSPDVRRTVEHGRTQAVINEHLLPTAQFQLMPDVDFAKERTLREFRGLVGDSGCHSVDATEAARILLGDTVGSNMLMVGYALQLGLLPVSLEAVERAVELNGVAIKFNLKALALGRLLAADPGKFDELLRTSQPEDVVTKPMTIEDRITLRKSRLVDYQNAAYADRYLKLVEKVRAAEHKLQPGSTRMTDAVAFNYYKLLAYKDEYEVARLYTTGDFERKIREQFEGDYKLHFHLAPPLLAKPDPVTGKIRKREYGPWMFKGFRILAGLKGLRGTAFDIFGYTKERRMERALIGEYEQLVGKVLAGANTANFDTAVQLLSLPKKIKGFGHVKESKLAEARKEQAALLDQFVNPANAERAAA